MIQLDPCRGRRRRANLTLATLTFAVTTGIVGAAGGLGGFFPPLVMGATYNEAGNDYTIGLLLLCATALVALTFTLLRLHREPVNVS